MPSDESPAVRSRSQGIVTVVLPEHSPALTPGAARVLLRILTAALSRALEGEPERADAVSNPPGDDHTRRAQVMGT